MTTSPARRGIRARIRCLTGKEGDIFNMNGRTHTAFVIFGLACFAAAIPAYSQTSAAAPASGPAPLPAVRRMPITTMRWPTFTRKRPRNSAAAREYVNKAIDYYKKAMALDPSASVIGEELAEFYLQGRQCRKGGRSRQQPHQGQSERRQCRTRFWRACMPRSSIPIRARWMRAALNKAIEHYQRAADIDPKDAESLSSLAHLYRVARKDDAGGKGLQGGHRARFRR